MNIPLNTTTDGCARIVLATYYKVYLYDMFFHRHLQNCVAVVSQKRKR